ncbi:suppressor of cytokine signaling 7-like [Dysidea avara]|uniref:suppressor of cytokine signaling 7-like n=1 Tax=Dysidea avara TaxID=196820 RepID=UPI003326377E
MAAPTLSEKSGLKDTLNDLARCGWYYGNISIQEAERLLHKEPDGSFLVRDCNDPEKLTELFTVTFKVEGCFGSFNIDYAKGLFSLCLGDPELPLFQHLAGLVGHCVHKSLIDKQAVCTVLSNSGRLIQLYLKKPVNRFRNVHTLKYYCRATLHRCCTRDKLEQLPLPHRVLTNYILKSPYYEDVPLGENDFQHCKTTINTKP